MVNRYGLIMPTSRRGAGVNCNQYLYIKCAVFINTYVRWADDTLIQPSSTEELEYIMNRLNTVSRYYKLKSNAQKTK